MNDDELKAHSDKCYLLESKLELLFVFSAKIKHFQLMYEHFNELSRDFVAILEHTHGRAADEYYLLQFERVIMEMLTQIFSMRDCLKNKLLDTVKEGENAGSVNGLLCAPYNIWASDYAAILSDTFDKSKVNKGLMKLSSVLRNKLTHHTLQKTRFILIEGKPQYGLPHNEWLLVCEYPHFVEELLGNDSSACEPWRYYLDDHIFCMQRSVLGPKEFAELERRATELGFVEILKKLHANIHDLERFLAVKPMRMDDPVVQQKYLEAHIPIYDLPLDQKEYRLFSYANFCEERKKGAGEGLKRRMYFNLHAAIRDIYALYFDYYVQLHRLVVKHHKEDLEEFDLLLKGGERILLKERYDYSMPKNPHAQFILQYKTAAQV